MRPWFIIVEATGHNAYVANRTDGTVWHYTIGTGGVLVFNTSVPSGTNANFIAVDSTRPLRLHNQPRLDGKYDFRLFDCAGWFAFALGYRKQP